VLVSGTRVFVLRLHSPHPAPAGLRGLPHQTSHDGCLCAGASQVVTRFGKRGKLQYQVPLRPADCGMMCRRGHQLHDPGVSLHSPQHVYPVRPAQKEIEYYEGQVVSLRV